MPYLKDGQTIVVWPGNYSALLFANMLRKGDKEGHYTGRGSYPSLGVPAGRNGQNKDIR